MLKVKLINEQASINNYYFVDNKEYIAGLPLTIKLQIQDAETKQRLIPVGAAKLNAIFQKSDGTELTVAGTLTFGADDRSVWSIGLTSVQTNDIVGSNMQIEIDFNATATVPPDLSDSTDLRSGMAYNVLSKVTFDGEC